MADLGFQTRRARLERNLITGASATEALQTWCDAHLRPPARVTAVRLSAFPKRAPDVLLDMIPSRLRGGLRHRPVELRYGAIPIVYADNWYLPGRLSVAMRTALDMTDEPFGRVIRPMRPSRRIVAVDRGPATPLRDHTTPILTLHAIVCSEDGEILACVHERFLPALIARAAERAVGAPL